jgi:hypothetical protein
MQRSVVRRRVPIPRTTTSKSQTKDYQYTRGLNSNSSNDDVSPDQLIYATDTRQNRVGKWDTRQGNDLLSIPIGEAVNVQQTSVTGASTFNFSTTTWFAKKITAGSTGRLTALEANIKNANAGTGTVVLALYSDSSGSPGTELVQTTVASNQLTGAFQYLKARSITCPDITSAGVYWVVGYIQDGGTVNYQISTTTNATTGKMSTDGGITWNAANVDFNVKVSTATNTPAKGCYRLRRPNGTSYTFIAHGTTLYQVNETTGVTTAVDTGLDSSSTLVRFDYVADVLRYTQAGVSVKPRKYDFTTAASVTAATENANCIINHAGLEFFISADDPSKVFYTNFGIYDTFTSTDFFYSPAPKTGDPLTGLSKLNGALYVHSRNNKYILSGKENATFQLDNAIGQKGTFSQESLVYDEDYIYLASDDGIYKFNGAEEANIATDVLDWWTGLLNKRNTVLELHNNRLYVFYTPNGESSNSRCKVYHILYGIWESDDTRTYVGMTYASADQTGYFIQASNRVGMLMLGEQSTNDYTTMGEPLSYELRTKYDHYGSPAQLKRAPDYRPHFDSVSGTYSITVGYATDYSDSPTETDIPLGGSGPRFDSGYTFDSGVTFGGSAQINPLSDAPQIPGEWRRLQIRYSHTAAREPVSFDGHVLSTETQRLI